jgi:hypothetical protein
MPAEDGDHVDACLRRDFRRRSNCWRLPAHFANLGGGAVGAGTICSKQHAAVLGRLAPPLPCSVIPLPSDLCSSCRTDGQHPIRKRK